MATDRDDKPSGKVLMKTKTTATTIPSSSAIVPLVPVPAAATATESKVGTRKSSRQKKSTLIYVDGYAVKKENNYIVKGTQYKYVFHSNDDTTDSKRQTHRLVKQQTARKQNGNSKSNRVISPAETRRAEMKESVESAIRDKSKARDAFLHSHLDALAPFIETKVYQRIKSKKGGTKALIETEVFMQPDAITADMRDYQLAGLNFMSNMYQNNAGMILGDGTCIGIHKNLSECMRRPFTVSHFWKCSQYASRNGAWKNFADYCFTLSHPRKVSNHGPESGRLSAFGVVLMVRRNQKVGAFSQISSVSQLQSRVHGWFRFPFVRHDCHNLRNDQGPGLASRVVSALFSSFRFGRRAPDQGVRNTSLPSSPENSL
jgi:hypothetical protein